MFNSIELICDDGTCLPIKMEMTPRRVGGSFFSDPMIKATTITHCKFTTENDVKIRRLNAPRSLMSGDIFRLDLTF